LRLLFPSKEASLACSLACSFAVCVTAFHLAHPEFLHSPLEAFAAKVAPVHIVLLLFLRLSPSPSILRLEGEAFNHDGSRSVLVGVTVTPPLSPAAKVLLSAAGRVAPGEKAAVVAPLDGD